MSKDIIWDSTEASAVTGGTSSRDWYATGVSMNIKNLRPGDLYVATKEDDLQQVFKKGAAAVMVSSCVGDVGDWPVLKVGDVFEALQNLARAARFRAHGTIISVQGREARQAVYDLLAEKTSVQEGGRHLSLGLANLSEDVEYGLFGSSPAVQPDIAVITNPAAANRDTLFETMPVNGTVIINADDEDFISVIARAKAAGIQTILTYGQHKTADARMLNPVQASILGDTYNLKSSNPAALAGLMILKITGKALPVFDVPEVKIIDPAYRNSEAVFRITNMIDLGAGRQTAMLDNIAHCALTLPKKDLDIPRRLANLDFVYTGKRFGAVPNAQQALSERHRNASVEVIAPDVLVPGDFVVFKKIKEKSQAMFSEALRLIPKKVKVADAL